MRVRNYFSKIIGKLNQRKGSNNDISSLFTPRFTNKSLKQNAPKSLKRPYQLNK